MEDKYIFVSNEITEKYYRLRSMVYKKHETEYNRDKHSERIRGVSKHRKFLTYTEASSDANTTTIKIKK